MADNGTSSLRSNNSENQSSEENTLEIAATAIARLCTPDKANPSKKSTNQSGWKN
jgi:hypothetical protein